jgi:hypothetical protein
MEEGKGVEEGGAVVCGGGRVLWPDNGPFACLWSFARVILPERTALFARARLPKQTIVLAKDTRKSTYFSSMMLCMNYTCTFSRAEGTHVLAAPDTCVCICIYSYDQTKQNLTRKLDSNSLYPKI